MAFSHIPDPLPPEGFPLPVDEIQGSFLTWGFLPGNSRNDINPRLVLYPDRLEIKVVTASTYEYTAIKRVDYRPAGWLRQERVAIYFNSANQASYSFIPSSAAIRRAFLQFCQQRGWELSEAALLALSQ
ncbi:hypothetical protein LRS06_08310 [Hymenobacter sp. J193]|uniref:hypothetical protein n=1 Tax=Hymenobacter sp. J193 TaxID=2898429 RepID=UPI002150A0B7|nr:hypothetical protein [Hymenobacter sp. J193]MCR5887779.1 hypothetical protein [Hymenobacter sp. J193]